MYEIFKFEIRYRLRRPETYVFFALLFCFSLIGIEFVFQGVELGQVKKNSPMVIAKTMGAISGLTMVLMSMIMGTSIMRDWQLDFFSLISVNPISKRDYLIGRYLGSSVILILFSCGTLLGMVSGYFMPWTAEAQYLPFNFINYLQPFLWVALPIYLFGGTLFFITGAITKKAMIVYTQGLIVFIVFILTKSISNESLQAILDPFSLSTLSYITKDWSPSQINDSLIPMKGAMLYHNVLWVVISAIILIIGYRRFKMDLGFKKVKRISSKQERKEVNIERTQFKPSGIYPSEKSIFSNINTLFTTGWFHARAILKLTSFWAIVFCSTLVMVVNSINLGTTYGVDSYPVAFLIIEELQETSIYFFIAILLFYAAELMWKEREASIDLIIDSTPVSSTIYLFSKLIGLVIIQIILLFALVLAGSCFQAFHGFRSIDVSVLMSGFYLELLPFFVLYSMLSLFFHALIGNKFGGIAATILFFMFNVVTAVFLVDHVLLFYGGNTLQKYSELNGYGHFLWPYVVAKGYWFLLATLLLMIGGSIVQRGGKERFFTRIRRGVRSELTMANKPAILVSILVLVFGGTIFYNTNIINHFWTKSEENAYRSGYEKTLKKYEYIQQPSITAVDLTVELYPSERAYQITGKFKMINNSSEPINQIHIQKLIDDDIKLFDVQFDRETKINSEHQKFHYTIYELTEPLSPGRTISMGFKQELKPKGFNYDSSKSGVLYNGTFINNDILPSLGYRKKYELKDPALRNEYGLPTRMKKEKRNHQYELLRSRTGSNSEGIFLNVIIGTEAPQSALTSGYLHKQWQVNGRNYFHYKTNKKIINFYAIVSGEYERILDNWSDENLCFDPVELEIYYHHRHDFNIARMMESIKFSLNYYSNNFSYFPFRQMRIVEFPRYHSYAQSFPSTIPFSEGIGFILNVKDDELDIPFFITAHEMAHQWWGIQLQAANVKGRNLILETLAQYSAMMVFKHKYSAEKLSQLLELQDKDYQRGRMKDSLPEPSLIDVEDQAYIYYAKGAMIMHELEELIGEENINISLRNFLNDWTFLNQKNNFLRYPTSEDLITYFLKETPIHLRSEVKNLFETVEE